MKARDFDKLCDQIDASIREQRPEMSALGREELLVDTLNLLRDSIDKKRKPKRRGVRGSGDER